MTGWRARGLSPPSYVYARTQMIKSRKASLRAVRTRSSRSSRSSFTCPQVQVLVEYARRSVPTRIWLSDQKAAGANAIGSNSCSRLMGNRVRLKIEPLQLHRGRVLDGCPQLRLLGWEYELAVVQRIRDQNPYPIESQLGHGKSGRAQFEVAGVLKGHLGSQRTKG